LPLGERAGQSAGQERRSTSPQDFPAALVTITAIGFLKSN